MKITIIKNGKPQVVPDYAKVQGILLGAIATFVIFITIIGPECVLVPISSFRTLEHLFVPFFRTETMDLTLSKRIRGSRTVVINGVRVKTKRCLRTSGQKVSTKNREVHVSLIRPQFPSRHSYWIEWCTIKCARCRATPMFNGSTYIQVSVGFFCEINFFVCKHERRYRFCEISREKQAQISLVVWHSPIRRVRFVARRSYRSLSVPLYHNSSSCLCTTPTFPLTN